MLERHGINQSNLHARDIHITTNNGRVQFRPQIEFSISPIIINSHKSELLS
jgi:hypothetical protein